VSQSLLVLGHGFAPCGNGREAQVTTMLCNIFVWRCLMITWFEKGKVSMIMIYTLLLPQGYLKIVNFQHPKGFPWFITVFPTRMSFSSLGYPRHLGRQKILSRPRNFSTSQSWDGGGQKIDLLKILALRNWDGSCDLIFFERTIFEANARPELPAMFDANSFWCQSGLIDHIRIIALLPSKLCE